MKIIQGTTRCSKHKSPDELINTDDKRTVEEKRRYFKEGDNVIATQEYRKLMNTIGDPEFENGTIIAFREPVFWDGKSATSLAYVEMPCGCVHAINTHWIKRK